VAAAAMLFAMIVLVRNEISPSERVPAPGYTQPVIEVANNSNRVWRPTETPVVTPQPGDYSPWSPGSAAPLPNTPVPVSSPVPTPTPTPKPTMTPRPTYTFRGFVSDEQGRPVMRAQVRIVSGGTQQAAERAAMTDKEGRFVIADIPDELLDNVIVEAPGYSVTMMENIPLPLPDELQIGMSALAGIDATVLDFATTGSEPVPFSGQMQASLLRLRPGDEMTTNSMGISEPVLPVDSFLPIKNQDVMVVEGLLQFDNVEPGTYRVAVKTGAKIAESEGIIVRDSGRSSTTLVLGMKHTVKGNVVAEDTGRALGQARVTMSPARQPSAAPNFPDYMSFTDGQGEFVLPEVQPGSYWMVIGAAGYTTKTLENFEVSPATAPEDTSVTLRKQKPLITVSITNGEGRPIAQAPLVLMTTSGPSPKTYFGKSDEAGLFRFENLLSGRYSLSVTAPGDRTRQKTLPVDLGDGEVKEMTITFGNAVAISGKVTKNGKAYKGLLSFVLRGAAIADNLVNTNDEGEFSIDLEPGEYMVGTPDKPAHQLITIKGPAAQTLNVELR